MRKGRIPKNKLIIFLVILSFSAVLLIAGTVLEVVNMYKEDNNTVEPTPTPEVPKEEDNYNEAVTKSNYIISNFTYLVGINGLGLDVYSSKVSFDNLKDESKLVVVLENLKGEGHQTTSEETTLVNDSNLDFSTAISIDKETVKNIYKDIWGKEIMGNYYNNSYYIPTDNLYIYLNNLKNNENEELLEYIYNKESIDGEINIYKAVGIKNTTTSDEGSEVVTLYKDYTKEEIVENETTLNESNYDKFSQYKINFTKTDDHYYFNYVEKIK